MIRSVEDLQQRRYFPQKRCHFARTVNRIFKMLRTFDKKKELSYVEWKRVFLFRYHTMCAVSPRCIFVHGGENFKSRQNKSDTSLICLAENQDSTWHQVLQSLSNDVKGMWSQKEREVLVILRDGCFLTDCMLKGPSYDYEIDFENVEGPEPEFVNLSRSPVIDSQPGGIYSLDSWAPLTVTNTGSEVKYRGI
jgi:hypothetical protein